MDKPVKGSGDDHPITLSEKTKIFKAPNCITIMQTNVILQDGEPHPFWTWTDQHIEIRRDEYGDVSVLITDKVDGTEKEIYLGTPDPSPFKTIDEK